VRARKCPYALLLRQHCPLPPSLSWLSQQQGPRQRRAAAPLPSAADAAASDPLATAAAAAAAAATPAGMAPKPSPEI